MARACSTVILVDDGLATGATMRAAVAALPEHGAEWVVAAVPVSSPETCAEFEDRVDEMVCARTPEPFYAVRMWYDDFAATTDEGVRRLLNEPRGDEDGCRAAAADAPGDRGPAD